jgi:hypothetical protein
MAAWGRTAGYRRVSEPGRCSPATTKSHSRTIRSGDHLQWSEAMSPWAGRSPPTVGWEPGQLLLPDRSILRVGPTSMRKPLSRPERDDRGTSQTSIRRHPRWRSARRGYAVAPIQYRGVAMRHVGPRDATWVPLPISTWTAPSSPCLCALDRAPVEIRNHIRIRW